MLSGIMSNYAKLTGEDLLRCLNKLDKEKLSAIARLAIWQYVLQNVCICLPYITAARTVGI